MLPIDPKWRSTHRFIIFLPQPEDSVTNARGLNNDHKNHDSNSQSRFFDRDYFYHILLV